MKTPFPRQAFVIAPELLEQTYRPEIEETFSEMAEAGLADPPFDEFDVTVPYHFMWGAKSFDDFTKNLRESFREDPEIRGAFNRPDDMVPPQHRFPGVFRFRRMPRQSPSEWPDVQYTFFGKEDVDPQYASLKDQPWGIWTHLGSPESGIAVERRRGDDGRPTFFARCHRAAHWLYALLVVNLVSKGISQKTRENKLAKLGIGKPGKRPYAFTTYISPAWRPYDGESDSDRGPVRPHFRRGHVRKQHYGPGRELVRTVFIRPVWVNMELGEPAQRDHYKVGADRAAP